MSNLNVPIVNIDNYYKEITEDLKHKMLFFYYNREHQKKFIDSCMSKQNEIIKEIVNSI